MMGRGSDELFGNGFRFENKIDHWIQQASEFDSVTLMCLQLRMDSRFDFLLFVIGRLLFTL